MIDQFDDDAEDWASAAWSLQQILEHAQQLAARAGLSELTFLIGIAAVAAEESRTEAQAAQPMGSALPHGMPRTIN